MLSFITENLELFLTLIMIFVELFSFLVLLFLRTKKKFPAISIILSKLPFIINHVEKLGKSGNEKKEMVLYIAKKLFQKEAGCDATSSVVKYFDEAIEDILSTPQKKGER